MAATELECDGRVAVSGALGREWHSHPAPIASGCGLLHRWIERGVPPAPIGWSHRSPRQAKMSRLDQSTPLAPPPSGPNGACGDCNSLKRLPFFLWGRGGADRLIFDWRLIKRHAISPNCANGYVFLIPFTAPGSTCSCHALSLCTCRAGRRIFLQCGSLLCSARRSERWRLG